MYQRRLIYFLSYVLTYVHCNDNFCYKAYKKQNDLSWKNGFLYEQNNSQPVDDVDFLDCLCKFHSCLTKCCKNSEILQSSVCVKDERLLDITPFLLRNNNENAQYLFKTKRVEGFMLDPDKEVSSTFKFTPSGVLYLPLLEGMETKSFGNHEYCVDIVKDNGTDFKVRVLLRPEPDVSESLEKTEISIKRWGMIISMPFLLVTFIVYAILPDRNLHMKALMCYVINLLFAYIFLVTIQLSDEVIEDTLCGILGFCCVFFFLSSFFWMNVICIDIFLGFRGFRGVPGVRSSERKRFLLYCLYAWGMSFLIVVITFLINTFGNQFQWFYPGVSVGQCFIRNGMPQLLYFYGPMGLIIIFNVVLFTMTALKIRQVKKDTAMLKHSESKRHSDDDQQNFYLYLKLLLAMGVNWTMELISWAVNVNDKSVPQYIWYLSDFCNATYGVFIFFIFVFKRNIWKQLQRRYYSFTGRHHLARSMATTIHTKTTNDSMTMSTNDRVMEESELNTTKVN